MHALTQPASVAPAHCDPLSNLSCCLTREQQTWLDPRCTERSVTAWPVPACLPGTVEQPQLHLAHLLWGLSCHFMTAGSNLDRHRVNLLLAPLLRVPLHLPRLLWGQGVDQLLAVHIMQLPLQTAATIASSSYCCFEQMPTWTEAQQAGDVIESLQLLARYLLQLDHKQAEYLSLGSLTYSSSKLCKCSRWPSVRFRTRHPH